MSRFVFDSSRYPAAPGCYLMRDSAGTVLYIGKAKNLRKRLATHFGGTSGSGRRGRLLAAVADIELILVSNETEALILENNLIKLHQPRANRVLLDADEGYFYIALTAEELPRLVPYRKNRINKHLERGGARTPVARYFGPYVGRRFRDTLLGFVSDHFGLRTCAPLASEVCLRYHLGACGGICEGRLAIEEYSRTVTDAVGFLARPHGEIIRQMRHQMLAYAAELRFEQASRVKRHIGLLEGALEPQIVERDVSSDRDVVHFQADSVLVVHVRCGAVHGLSFCAIAGSGVDDFLLNRYSTNCPDELIVNQVADARGLEQQLRTTTGHRVRVTVAAAGQRGTAQRLLLLAALNHAYRATQCSDATTSAI